MQELVFLWLEELRIRGLHRLGVGYIKLHLSFAVLGCLWHVVEQHHDCVRAVGAGGQCMLLNELKPSRAWSIRLPAELFPEYVALR